MSFHHPMPKIADNLKAVYRRVDEACEKAGRNRDQVQVLAVSKTRSVDEVQQAYDIGCRDFGENYLQDALEKISSFNVDDISWHFIGHLQSNKSRQVAEHFQWMHSVDRLKIAQRLNDQRPEQLPPLNICLQVNISDEASKAGISAAELPSLAAQIANLDRLCLRGLMVIPAASTDPQLQRHAFAKSYQLFINLQAQYPQVDTLSMGMSGDLNAAIQEGSTMVRIGTDIFGQRPSHLPQHH